MVFTNQMNLQNQCFFRRDIIMNLLKFSVCLAYYVVCMDSIMFDRTWPRFMLFKTQEKFSSSIAKG